MLLFIAILDRVTLSLFACLDDFAAKWRLHKLSLETVKLLVTIPHEATLAPVLDHLLHIDRFLFIIFIPVVLINVLCDFP